MFSAESESRKAFFDWRYVRSGSFLWVYGIVFVHCEGVLDRLRHSCLEDLGRLLPRLGRSYDISDGMHSLLPSPLVVIVLFFSVPMVPFNEATQPTGAERVIYFSW